MEKKTGFRDYYNDDANAPPAQHAKSKFEAERQLLAELAKGEESARQSGWVSEQDIRNHFGLDDEK